MNVICATVDMTGAAYLTNCHWQSTISHELSACSSAAVLFEVVSFGKMEGGTVVYGDRRIL